MLWNGHYVPIPVHRLHIAYLILKGIFKAGIIIKPSLMIRKPKH